MQRNKNETTHAACAACKHQRKKCSVNCALAPHFPANRNREFQAVHRVFGVSNMTKLVKQVREEHRGKVVDSLTWEAFCRQQDPILGSYGQYKKVHDQYTNLLQHLHININNDVLIKDHQNLHQILQLPFHHHHHQELKSFQNHHHLVNNTGDRSSVEDGLEFSHHHHDPHHRNNVIVDSALYGFDFSQTESFKSEVVLNHQFQQHHPPYYYSGNDV